MDLLGCLEKPDFENLLLHFILSSYFTVRLSVVVRVTPADVALTVMG
jgi:hypothetical protein